MWTVRILLLFASVGALMHSGAAAAAPAETPRDAGTRLQLFLDRDLIGVTSGVELRLHPPQRREVVLTLDAPWEGNESGYATLLRDGDEYRMYYRGGGESTTREVTCLATSRDGIHWLRPTLGLFEAAGTRKNNVIFTAAERKAYGESHNFTPFLDANPACRPEERYKALALGHSERGRALLAMASPDGISWKHLSKDPVLTTGSFDSQNVAFWDPNRGSYACYARQGRNGLRSVIVSTSTDFLRWSEPEWVELEPDLREQFYTNAIQLYPREPSVYVGFPMRFVPARKSIGWPERKVDGLSDAVLISSRDGRRFARTFPEALIRPGLNPLNWGNAHGNNTPVWGLLQLSPEEISIYWLENYGGQARVRRGVVRTDGFASMNAGAGGGEFVTRPLTFEGGRLRLNYATSAVGAVRVEVQDADGKPLPGFVLDRCPEIYGDELERDVRWTGDARLSDLAGRPVRLRFVMRDADLYSWRFLP